MRYKYNLHNICKICELFVTEDHKSNVKIKKKNKYIVMHMVIPYSTKYFVWDITTKTCTLLYYP